VLSESAQDRPAITSRHAPRQKSRLLPARRKRRRRLSAIGEWTTPIGDVYVSRPMPSSPDRGRLFVIAAPSGAGKTSLVKALLQRKPDLHVSISYPTRKRRPTEEDGREYHFISVADFQQLAAQGQFLE